MATLWARASILLRDKGKNICKCVVLVAAAALDPSGGAVAAIRAAIQAITKAVSSRAETGTQAGPAGATVAGAGSYRNSEDKAVLTFRGDDNSTYNFELPAPKATIFLPGSDVVDIDDPDLEAYVGWIEDNCVGSFGQELTFVKGERTRKKDFVND
jgi:hypothetical protein